MDIAIYIIKIQRSRIMINESLTGVDGIILKKNLPFGKYDFQNNMLKMRSKSGVLSFQVGQKVLVKVDKIDLISQKVFFIFSE